MLTPYDPEFEHQMETATKILLMLNRFNLKASDALSQKTLLTLADCSLTEETWYEWVSENNIPVEE
jgi:hypothetical protein